MKKNILKLLFLLFINLSVFAKVIESDSLSVINDYLDKDTIVVFDIDNTVGVNSLDLDSWFPEYVKFLEKKGVSQSDAFFHALNLYYVLQNFVDFSTVGGSREFISSLQNLNIPVIALTNRSRPVIDVTLKQLHKVGIDFIKTSPFKEDLNVSVTYSGRYSKGIIFCGSNDKGAMLFRFFDLANYKPKKIIFIDDKQKYVDSVDRVANQRGIDAVCIRLSLQDKIKENINYAQLNKEVHDLKVNIGLEPLNI